MVIVNYVLITEGPRNRSAGQPLVISDVRKGSIAHRSAFVIFEHFDVALF